MVRDARRATLNAFTIFHSSECSDIVNVPGGNGAVAVERSSAYAIEQMPMRLAARYRLVFVITASKATCGFSPINV
jgi:hypothetical protein